MIYISLFFGEQILGSSRRCGSTCNQIGKMSLCFHTVFLTDDLKGRSNDIVGNCFEKSFLA